jgi:aryl-alcohol dehydrogenase-like predicted oxidoreductase
MKRPAALLQRALEQGINFFDTADVYSKGSYSHQAPEM